MSSGGDDGAGVPGNDGAQAPTTRGAALRRALIAQLPVPDLARDAGGALAADPAVLDLGGDAVAEPLEQAAQGRAES